MSTYVYTFHPELIPTYVQKILTAMPTTLYLVVFSLLFSLIIGLLLTAAQVKGGRALRSIAHGYISFMRGVPSLVLILLLFMGVPQIMASFGVSMSGVAKTSYIIAAMTLLTSANVGEMMRSSYLAVDHGQVEAALSVGMTPFQALRRITLPQAVAVAIPNFGNNVISLFKETSLAFTIGALDLMGKAQTVSAASYGTYRLEVYISVALIYWTSCLILQLITTLLERATSRGRSTATA